MTYPTAERMTRCRAWMAKHAAAGGQRITIDRLWIIYGPTFHRPRSHGERLDEYERVLRRKQWRHVKFHRAITAEDRRAVRLARRCTYCFRLCEVVIDHIVPVSRGGTRFRSNLAAACEACNASKSDMTVSEWSDTKYYATSVEPRRATIAALVDRYIEALADECDAIRESR